jgi:hypothetical protein
MALDHPFFEVAAAAAATMREGFTIHQKFTCFRCRARQTMAIPNVFFHEGKCAECGAVTNILVTGCNYVAMAGVPERMH